MVHTLIALPNSHEHYSDNLPTYSDIAKALGPISWTWQNWIPNGFVTLIVGHIGSGKSILAAHLDRIIIEGGTFPDGTIYQPQPDNSPRRGLFCDTESAQAINAERMKAWNVGDLMRHPLPLGEDGIPTDISLEDRVHRAAIEAAAHDRAIRVVTIDSLSGGHTQDECTGTVGQFVKWFAGISMATGKPCDMVHHLRKLNYEQIKAGYEINLHDIRGHSSIGQYARVIIAVDHPDPRSEYDRIRVIKSNIGIIPDPIGFRVDNKLNIHFGEAPGKLISGKERKIDSCKQEIIKIFLTCDPTPSLKMESHLFSEGYSESTVNRARSELKINAYRDGNVWMSSRRYKGVNDNNV